ncbi:MAG: hypothetical protein LAT57_07405 [Balneolales bacterium]|nr:hypothetical protein [Balneolales bacterium]
MNENNNTELENAEYGVDSRYTSTKEKKADTLALLKARLERMTKVTDEHITRAKLMQLRLKD